MNTCTSWYTQAYFSYWYCVCCHSHHISCVCCWWYKLHVNENVWDILTSTASPRSVWISTRFQLVCIHQAPLFFFFEARSMTFPKYLFLSVKQDTSESTIAHSLAFDLQSWRRRSNVFHFFFWRELPAGFWRWFTAIAINLILREI